MIGEIFNGIATLAGAAANYSAQKKAQKQQKENIEKGQALVKSGYDEIDDYLDSYKKTIDSRKLTNEADLEDYKGMVKNYDAQDYVAERGTFDKSGYDVEDYINENRDAIVKKAADEVSRSAAGAGVGRGTGAATDIAEAVAAKDEELYNQAYERMKDDRNFDYSEFQAQYEANQKALDTLNQGFQTKVTMLGGAIQQDNQAEDDYISDVIASKTGRTNANVSLLT